MHTKTPGSGRIQTLGDLYELLRVCWCRQTAYPSCQDEWEPDDPSYGQCSVTAMVVCDLFGGTIHRIRVSDGGSHYFNKIEEHYIDLTWEQFGLYDIPVAYEPNEEITRRDCGCREDTQERYQLLVSRLEDAVRKGQAD
jgi:hypothetical protein